MQVETMVHCWQHICHQVDQPKTIVQNQMVGLLFGSRHLGVTRKPDAGSNQRILTDQRLVRLWQHNDLYSLWPDPSHLSLESIVAISQDRVKCKRLMVYCLLHSTSRWHPSEYNTPNHCHLHRHDHSIIESVHLHRQTQSIDNQPGTNDPQSHN